ncbi:RICIN domain-containing protein [Streptomyces sp. NPDC040750]|uniref:RICIN domain-containing protein n=1 Tax=Streptomyces sp. NPDC040750 TaxID=3154491 RepID=UPI0033F72C08
MRTRSAPRPRGTMVAAAVLSLGAASLAAAETYDPVSPAPAVRAAEAADIPGQEIINRSDGSRLGIWDDGTSNGNRSATHRSAGYERRKTLTWRFQDRGDGTWRIRNETAGQLCLATESAPAVGVRVILGKCDADDPAQSWRTVPEQTDLPHDDPGGTATGWWSLRPADSTELAAAVERIGADFSGVLLYRATNSVDRLWHQARPWRSW